MTQPLNYTPKAIEALLSYPCPGAPGTAAAMQYLAGKLREAQVFVLSDHGELLDRSKPRPQFPGLMLKPPFPVMALEYTAQRATGGDDHYTGASCTKRIALVWEWTADLPALHRVAFGPLDLGPGVVIASLAFYDDQQLWMPVAAAMHLPFDALWMEEDAEIAPFARAMLEAGRITKEQLLSPRLAGTAIPLLLEPLLQMSMALGGMSAALDTVASDVSDEVAAYIDLCSALACKNVGTRATAAPDKLNRQRIKAGKVPLKGFHVLELASGVNLPGQGGIGDRSGPRSHLRRGHIRRLPGERVTWVNSAIVRGRGFVDKVYAA
ncbi:MAG: hypothetical protein PGN16_08535 [Sphingomonas phyllosphaerae]|uniref:hypothetical protein n=1 Tax=Sphingomonas phyllosphaerae TaxID=257003 RepID=UPI002FFBE461